MLSLYVVVFSFFGNQNNTKIQKQMENIMYERVDSKTLHKIFSFYGNWIRECFDKIFLMMWKF
jgi:hypothetical protein